MNKKANTAIFIVVATLLNILLMLALFVLSFALIARFVDPESPLVPLWLGLAFIVSIGGSFLLYRGRQFHLEKIPGWSISLALYSKKQKKKTGGVGLMRLPSVARLPLCSCSRSLTNRCFRVVVCTEAMRSVFLFPE
jgi:hypothetical protein